MALMGCTANSTLSDINKERGMNHAESKILVLDMGSAGR